MNLFHDFFKKKGVFLSSRIYAVDAMSAMAQGLFASLLIGSILATIGKQLGMSILVEIGSFAIDVKGASMAVAIAYALKAPALVMFSLAAVGFAADKLGGAGGPLAVYFIAVIACEIGKLVSKETKLDIIITPGVTIIAGSVLAILFAPYIAFASLYVGEVIMTATKLKPFLMGAVVAVIVGIALTLPISSAAICAALNLQGIAAGAALAGCCAHMIGFAVISFKANGVAGLVAQGIGTSMLQMPNIIKKPVIALPPVIASAICGIFASYVFGLEMNGPALAAGMGTCGLVGPLGVYTGWIDELEKGARLSITATDITALVLICFILPALISLLVSYLCKKYGLFTDEDMKLDL